MAHAGRVTAVIAYGIAAFIAFAGLPMFMFAAWAVALARHFHGKRLIRQCRRMHTLFLKSSRVAVERTKLRGHAMTGIAIGALACCFDPWICSAIALSLLGYTCVAATKIYLPATVLYLATSTPSRLLFLHRLQRRVPNVTAMLDASNLPPEGTEGYSPTPNFHSMFDSRTCDDADWHEVFETLIDIAPTVLLDTRDVSSSVLYEVEQIFSRSLHGKTLFIAGETGEIPALEHVDIAEGVADSLIYVTQEILLWEPNFLLFWQVGGPTDRKHDWPGGT
jgi:hypothetical protein